MDADGVKAVVEKGVNSGLDADQYVTMLDAAVGPFYPGTPRRIAGVVEELPGSQLMAATDDTVTAAAEVACRNMHPNPVGVRVQDAELPV